MKRTPITAVIALLLGMSSVSPALAGETTLSVTHTIEVEDVFSDEDVSLVSNVRLQPPMAGVATFGPFRVVNANTVELDGVIDSAGPDHLRRLLARFPGIKLVRMVECPGSEDDDANLQVARMIRRAGISTHVPAHGSIRSGGVELFLAGLKRTSEPGAKFGVHSWVDEDGREAKDYAAADPVHQEYVKFYQEMGLQPDRARAFYHFTNAAAPSTGVHYMSTAEIQRFGLTN